MMARFRTGIIAMLLVASLLLVACGTGGRSPTPPPPPQTSPPPSARPVVHQLGAFNIVTPAQARAAAAAGVSIDFAYGNPPTPKGHLGKQLEGLGMSVVSARVWGLVHEYECHRLRNNTTEGVRRYCQGVKGGATTEHALFTQVRAFAHANASNPLLAGYWILDDQPGTDFGSLRQILVEIADIMHHYAPSRPTLCGVGAFITTGGGYVFNPALLEDVSTEACDQIGIYVYSAPQMPPHLLASSTYDWTMAQLLSTVRTHLQAAGLGGLPWIGVGQAWGGVNRYDGSVMVTPSAQQMTEQASAFCQAGASGMTWYAWTLTAFRDLRSPATDARLTDGVVLGGRACEAAWA